MFSSPRSLRWLATIASFLLAASVTGLVAAPQDPKPGQQPPAQQKAEPPAAAPQQAAPAQKAAVPAQKPAAPAAQPPRAQQARPPLILNGRLAQFGRRTPTSGDIPPLASFVQPERELLRGLSQAQQLLQDNRYSEAVRMLGEILSSPEDGALPAAPDQPMRFLKAEAQRLIGEMPREGRDAYEREFGQSAQKALTKAIAAADLSGIEKVAGEFFHTKAGYEAMHLLGSYHLDHGRSLAAALCFQRLRASGSAQDLEPALSLKTAACWMWADQNDKALEVLRDLKRNQPSARVQIAGKEFPLYGDESQAIAWLAGIVGATPQTHLADPSRWAMFRGNPARNASTEGSRPLLSLRWHVPTTSDPKLREMVENLRLAYLEQSLTALPSLHPLVVNDGRRDVVLTRTTHNLLAIDLATGKRIWEIPTDDSVERLLNGDPNSQANLQFLISGLDERLWDDTTYGTLSSDGDLVYAIEDLTLNPGLANQSALPGVMIVMPNGRRRLSTSRSEGVNRLAAYELKSEGKLKWALGGPIGDEALPEADSFFLGAPLPVAGRLYAMAESKGQIRLLAIDPRRDPLKGEKLVEWSQRLVDLEQDILANTLRRVAGTSPSYADGVLVCPTSAGAVAAVDLTTRALLWGYAYPSDVRNNQGRISALQMSMYPGGNTSNPDRWVDAAATIAEGRVLITPVDSTQLHCVSLTDGKPLWKAQREDGLYIGCVHNGIALVVGRGHLRSYKLADGQPAWEDRAVPLPPGGIPSGRGFHDGGKYYLPLSTAEVLIVDVATGQLSRSSTRRGSVPGNLVAYKGAVVSQTVDGVERFEQIDVLRDRVAARLKENPDDPAALVERAEVLLDDGKLEQAVAELRRSLKLQHDLRTQELLVEGLLEGMRLDFNKHRAWADEAKPLLTQPQQQAAYLRLLAEGLQQAGETMPAFDAYMQLADLRLDKESLQKVDPTHSVRQDRWVRARLSLLRSTAPPKQVAAMDEAIQKRYEAAVAQSGPDALRQFVRYFDGNPSADRARLELAQRLVKPEERLEVELLLRQVEQGGSTELAGEAVARLAQLLDRAKRPEQAVYYYRRLAKDFADRVCLDGKTGSQLVADSSVRGWIEPREIWPAHVSKQSLGGSLGGVRSFAFETDGSQGPVLADQVFEWDSSKNSVVSRDGFGRSMWTVALSDNNQNRYSTFGFNQNFSRARVCGNYLLVAMGYEVFAIDGLAAVGSGSSGVLWRQNLLESIPGLGNVFSFSTITRANPWGGRVVIGGNPYSQNMVSLGPASARQVCFQRLRNLVGVDPLTGETLWVRQNIAQGSSLFGDGDLVFVVAPNGSEAVVYRATDGQELGRRQIPSANERMSFLGRNILTFSTAGGKTTIRLFDPWDQRDVWEAPKFAAGAKANLWRQETLAVLEPAGRIVLLDVADGRMLADSPIEQLPSTAEVYLLGSRENWVVVTNRTGQSDVRMNNMHPIPGGASNPKIDGFACGFDRRTGKKLWETKVERQGLYLDQPSELPVLVFASHVYNVAAGSTQPSVSVHVIDKRTGKEIHKKTTAGSVANYELAADLDKKTIDLKIVRDSIRMVFSPDPPAEPEAEKKPAEKP